MAKKTGPHYVMSADHRDKIANSNILNYLIEHAQGVRKMSPTQVHAGLSLLRKVLPDLASVDLTTQGQPITGVRRWTEAEWLAYLTTQGHNSNHTTTEPSDMPSVSVTDGQVRH